MLDPDHAFHERAHEWWANQAKLGWASCPITENGFYGINAPDKDGIQYLRMSSLHSDGGMYQQAKLIQAEA